MDLNKACLHLALEKQGTKNYPFITGAEGEGFKNLLYSFVYFKKVLTQEYGIDFATRDINTPEDSYFLVCWDDPHTIKAEKKPGQLWILLIYEPVVYAPEGWDKKYHEKFDYVFTFDETLVDNKKYFYYPFAMDTKYFSIPNVVSEEEFKRRKLATIVSNAVHKYPDPQHPGSTHHLRYNTIKWYGKHHPDDFGFYSGSFLKRDYYFGFKGARVVKKLLPAQLYNRLAAAAQQDLLKVFQSELTPLGKFEVIKNYNFYYCYENTVGTNGYVSEKIFDCFYSGLVPIYWGAPNVKELIPYKCFIEGKDFDNDKSLYSFIKGMDYQTYRSYLEQAQIFLRSREMERFTVKYSIDCILKPIHDLLINRTV